MNNSIKIISGHTAKMPQDLITQTSNQDYCFEAIDLIDDNCDSDNRRHHYKERQLKAIKAMASPRSRR